MGWTIALLLLSVYSLNLPDVPKDFVVEEAIGNCTWHGLPYDIDICSDFHGNKTDPSQPSVKNFIEPVVREVFKISEAGNEPLECVGCIVEKTFADLIAANFGLVYEACNICSCRKLTEDQCVSVIKDALYAAIAAMPLLAVHVF